MTHTCKNWFNLCGSLRWHHDPLYSDEEIFSDFNYGDITIDILNRKANVSIKNMKNEEFLTRTFDLTKDLIYKADANGKNSLFC